MRAGLRDPRSMSGDETRYLNEGLVTFGRALADLAHDDERIVAGSADLSVSTLFIEFQRRHPKRFFQFGISERNMISAAAGLASAGLRPYVSTFAAFAALLGLENIRTDLAYANMPVRLVGTHAGIALGFLTTSHHATEDIAATRAIADLMVLSPPDGPTAAALAAATVDHDGPIYFRLGRGRDPEVYDEIPADYGPGAPRRVREGADVLLVATGIMVERAARAAEELEAAGVSATVLDVHTLKPFPADVVAALAGEHAATVSIEEHSTEGGLGTLTQEAVADSGAHTPVYKHGFHDEYVVIGPPNQCYRYYGLDPAGIATVTRRVLDRVGQGSFYPRRADEPLWTQTDRAAVLERVRSAPARERVDRLVDPQDG